MGRPTVLGVGSQMGAGKSATTYVSTIPSANQAANGKLKKTCCAQQAATGTTSLTSDNSGNDHQGTGNGVGGYLKKTFKKKLLKARNPRAADLQAYVSAGDAQIHTHVNPLSPEASTLLQMIHGCDWALVREHLSTKKGAHEFHKALEYDETSQAMSLDLNTGASVTSESIDGSMHALREPEVITNFVPVPQPMKSRHLKKKHSGSEYVSPGTVSQSNFGAVKKVTATQSNKQQQSRPESAVNSNPVANNNNDDSAHSGTVDEDLEDEDNFDDDSLLRTSTASVSSSLRVDNALRSSLQGSVVLNGADGGGGGGNSSVRSGGSGSKSSHKGGKIKTISCTPTLLHLLCTLNPPVQMVQRVLSQKPSFAQAMNNLEQTPLHLCCVYGASPQVIQCLLKHNKRLATLLDHRGRTALHLLCEVGIRKEQEEIMSGRIGSSRSGYDSSDNDDDDLEDEEETPVKECMEFLLWAYPDAVLLVDSEKKIPLDYAVAAKAHPKWILQLQKIQNSRFEMLHGNKNNKLHQQEEEG